MLHFFINKAKWEELPKTYQAIVRAAAHTANTVMLARYDAQNATALKRLAVSGAQLKPFSEEVLDACFKASNEVFDENAAKNADFKKVYEAMKVQRGDNYLWFQLAEYTQDTFMMIQQRKKTI